MERGACGPRSLEPHQEGRTRDGLGGGSIVFRMGEGRGITTRSGRLENTHQANLLGDRGFLRNWERSYAL